MIADMKNQGFSKIIVFFFHLLFILVPLLFTSVNDELFEFNKMLAVYVFTLIIGTFWVGECIRRQKIVWKRTPLDLPIGFFLLSQLLSTVFSINVHTSLFGYYSRFNGGLFSIFAYIFLYYMFVIFVNKDEIGKLLRSLLIGGVLSALYALPEHFGHSPSCLIFTGNFDVACWVQDVKTRVFGTFGQPNWLAAYLGMLLPLAIVNSKHVETQTKLMDDDNFSQMIQTIVRLLIGVLFIAVLFFTGSRSGIIAVAVGLFMLGGSLVLIWLKVNNEKHEHFLENALKQYALMLAIIFIAALSISLIVRNPIQDKFLRLLQRATPTTQTPNSAPPAGTQLEIGGSESGQIRNIVWKGAWLVWQRYPLFGSGVETFAYSYYKDRPQEHNQLSEWDFLYNKAHNEFMNFLATTGIFGFLAYITMLSCMIILPLVTAFKLLSTKAKKLKSHSELIIHHIFILISLSAGLIIVSISNFFGFSTVMVSLLAFIFPAISVVIASSHHETSKIQVGTELDNEMSSSQWIAFLCTFALFSLPLLYIRKLWVSDVAFAKGKQLDNFGQQDKAFPYLRQATELLPEEPTFHDEYSYNLASLAVAFAKQSDATRASEFASEAIKESDTAISLNPVHTIFWKTRIKVFLTLATLGPHFTKKAEEALMAAQVLSPTDPKIILYLGLLAESEGDKALFLSFLLKAIELKPNFEEARNYLAKYYEEQKQPEKALEQYRYMVEFINPNNITARDKIASLSAKKK